jgi:hypothetical protein
MSWLITIFRDVPDPGAGNATRHDLLDVLTIALTASICGCESCVEFADFAEDRQELFREFLSLTNGLPSHDTFSRLFRLIDPHDAVARLPRARHRQGGDRGAPAARLRRQAPRRCADGVVGTMGRARAQGAVAERPNIEQNEAGAAVRFTDPRRARDRLSQRAIRPSGKRNFAA